MLTPLPTTGIGVVCEAYEWVPAEPIKRPRWGRTEDLDPRLGPALCPVPSADQRNYDPMSAPELLEDLLTYDLDRDGLLALVTRWGFPILKDRGAIRDRQLTWAVQEGDIRETLTHLRNVTELWRLAETGAAATIEGLIDAGEREYNVLDPLERAVYLQQVSMMDGRLHRVAALGGPELRNRWILRIAVEQLIARELDQHARVLLFAPFEPDGASEALAPRLHLTAVNPLGAAYIRFAGLLERGQAIRRCEKPECGRYFTPKTPHHKFCKTSHRVTMWQRGRD